MNTIHPTALVDKNARLGENIQIGPYSIVEADTEIGDGTLIESHVVIVGGTRIGKNVRISHHCTLGGPPQDLKYANQKTTLVIGDNTIIREFCDFNRGTTAHGTSVVGKDCFIMAYCHVAHDCTVGDKVIMANSVHLAGHTTVEEWVNVGGLVPVHQFCTIGKHAFIGGGFRVAQDVPPYILAAGLPLSFKGLNIVGLKRRGFPPETISALRKCYRYIYNSKMNTTKALEAIRSEMEIIPEVQYVIDFIERSERGFIK